MKLALLLVSLILAGSASGQIDGDSAAALGKAVGTAADGQLWISNELGGLAGSYGDYDQGAWLQQRQDESDSMVGGLRAVDQDLQSGKADPAQLAADIQTITKAMSDLKDKLSHASAHGLPKKQTDDGSPCDATRPPCAASFTASVRALASEQDGVRGALADAAVAAARSVNAAKPAPPISTTSGGNSSNGGEAAPPDRSNPTTPPPVSAASPGDSAPPTTPTRRRRGSGTTPPSGTIPSPTTTPTPGATSTSGGKKFKPGTTDWKPPTSGLKCPDGHHICQSGYSAWCEDNDKACGAPPPNAPQYDPCNPDQCKVKPAGSGSLCSKFLDSNNKPGYSCSDPCAGKTCSYNGTCVDQGNGVWGCSNGKSTCATPTPYMCYYDAPLNRWGCSATPCANDPNAPKPICIPPCDPNTQTCAPDPSLPGAFHCVSTLAQCVPAPNAACNDNGQRAGTDSATGAVCYIPCDDLCVEPTEQCVPSAKYNCGQQDVPGRTPKCGRKCSFQAPRCCYSPDCTPNDQYPACEKYADGHYPGNCMPANGDTSCKVWGGPCTANLHPNPGGGCVPPSTLEQEQVDQACLAQECGSTVGTALLNSASCVQMCACKANPCACQRQRSAHH